MWSLHTPSLSFSSNIIMRSSQQTTTLRPKSTYTTYLAISCETNSWQYRDDILQVGVIHIRLIQQASSQAVSQLKNCCTGPAGLISCWLVRLLEHGNNLFLVMHCGINRIYMYMYLIHMWYKVINKNLLCELSLMSLLKPPANSRLDRNSASLWLCPTKHRFVVWISL